jgi:hypothetical protein
VFGDERALPIVGNFDPPLATVAPGGGADLPGDYDRNGTVDMADKLVWRAGYGSASNHAADGNHDGRVDAADYVTWRNNLGKTSASATAILLEATSPSASLAASLANQNVMQAIKSEHSTKPLANTSIQSISRAHGLAEAADRLFARLGDSRAVARPRHTPTRSTTLVENDELLLASAVMDANPAAETTALSLAGNGQYVDEAIDELVAETAGIQELLLTL